jgi:hypothetical protein
MARVRRSRVEWRALVRAFRQSGETAATFAVSHDLGANTLRWWCTQLRDEEGAGPVDFVDFVVDEPLRVDPFVVIVAGHQVIVPRGFDTVELRRLVDALC